MAWYTLCVDALGPTKNSILSCITEFSLEFREDVAVGVIWEELLTTSKFLCSTYSKIKGICSLKALKFKCLKYTGENTVILCSTVALAAIEAELHVTYPIINLIHVFGIHKDL